MTTEEVIAAWRKHIGNLRRKQGVGRDGQQNEYEWNKAANLIEQVLDDIEATL